MVPVASFCRSFLSTLLEDVSYFPLGFSASISLWSEKHGMYCISPWSSFVVGFVCLVASYNSCYGSSYVKKPNSLLCSINTVPSYSRKCRAKLQLHLV